MGSCGPGPRREFTLCRAVLRALLCRELGCGNEQLSFGVSDHGKPFEIPPAMNRGATSCLVRLPVAPSVRWRLENLGNRRYAAARPRPNRCAPRRRVLREATGPIPRCRRTGALRRLPKWQDRFARTESPLPLPERPVLARRGPGGRLDSVGGASQSRWLESAITVEAAGMGRVGASRRLGAPQLRAGAGAGGGGRSRFGVPVRRSQTGAAADRPGNAFSGGCAGRRLVLERNRSEGCHVRVGGRAAFGGRGVSRHSRKPSFACDWIALGDGPIAGEARGGWSGRSGWGGGGRRPARTAADRGTARLATAGSGCRRAASRRARSPVAVFAGRRKATGLHPALDRRHVAGRSARSLRPRASGVAELPPIPGSRKGSTASTTPRSTSTISPGRRSRGWTN